MAASASLGAPAPVLAIVDGIPTTTSLEVARHFNRPHDEVLRRVRNLVAQLDGEPLRNFAEGSYTLPITGDQQHPMYRLTRDGFTLLAMGFTGKRALQFKLAYIDAFNRMEAELQQRALNPAPIDVRARLLGGQSTPPACGYPARVEAAIDQAAWKMAREAYELVHEHLRRRVAHRFIFGPDAAKRIDVQGALAEIKQTTLGHCLTREAMFYQQHAVTAARLALRSAQNAVAELDKQMAALNATAPWVRNDANRGD